MGRRAKASIAACAHGLWVQGCLHCQFRRCQALSSPGTAPLLRERPALEMPPHERSCQAKGAASSRAQEHASEQERKSGARQRRGGGGEFPAASGELQAPAGTWAGNGAQEVDPSRDGAPSALTGWWPGWDRGAWAAPGAGE